MQPRPESRTRVLPHLSEAQRSFTVTVDGGDVIEAYKEHLAERELEREHHWTIEHSPFTDEFGFKSFRITARQAAMQLPLALPQ